MFECGTYQGKENCGTRNDEAIAEWRSKCGAYMVAGKKGWSEVLLDVQNKLNSKAINDCSESWLTATKRKRVFVMTSNDDHNFYHVIVDSLAQIARYLPFLRNHPDVLIHIRNTNAAGPQAIFSSKNRGMN